MNFLNQLKYAVASLKLAPGFVVTSISTLSITMAALLLVISINSAFLIKPLNYPNEDKLVWMQQHTISDGYDGHQFQTVKGHLHWYKTQTSLERLSLVLTGRSVVGSLPGEPRTAVSYVTPEYFEMFATPLAIGRGFLPSETIGNKAKVVLISEEIWRRDLNSADNVLEQFLEVDNQQYQIIGVVGKDFNEPHLFAPKPTGVWLPFDAGGHMGAKWDSTYGQLKAIGQLKVGVNYLQLEADLENSIENIRDQWKEGWPDLQDINPYLTSFREGEVGDNAKLGLMLLAGAVSLLLIAIINVTNLFFSRAVAKQKMLAIQAVLGARRRRLFHTLLAESGLICGVSAIVGLFLAAWGLQAFVSIADGHIPLLHNLSMDITVLISAVVVTMLLSLMFSASTARLIDYQELKRYIQSSGKGGPNQVSSKTIKGLIMLQVLLASFLLLFSAMILSKALQSKYHPLGAEIEDVFYLFTYSTQPNLNLNDKAQLREQIRDEFAKANGVVDVATGVTPIHKRRTAYNLSTVEGNSLGFFDSKFIGTGYFDLMNIKLLRGREISDAAYRNEIHEMLVTESAARKLDPNGDALGKTFLGIGNKPYEVVGITEDVIDPKFNDGDQGVRVWWPMIPNAFPFVIKMKSGEHISRLEVHQVIKKVSESLMLWDYAVVEQNYNDAVYQETLTIYLTSTLTFFTLLLACVGIFGVVSYSSNLRRYEFGIRMALGAKTRFLRKLMFFESMKPAGLGMIIGIVACLLTLLVFGDKFSEWIDINPMYLALSVLITVSTVAMASILPVIRLLKSNPIEALRSE